MVIAAPSIMVFLLIFSTPYVCIFIHVVSSFTPPTIQVQYPPDPPHQHTEIFTRYHLLALRYRTRQWQSHIHDCTESAIHMLLNCNSKVRIFSLCLVTLIIMAQSATLLHVVLHYVVGTPAIVYKLCTYVV